MGDLVLLLSISMITLRAICKRYVDFAVCIVFVGGATFVVFEASNQTMLAATQPTFSTDIAPILQKNCMACHSGSAHKGRLVLETYEELMKGGRHGQVIVPDDAASSRLVQMLEGKMSPQMPVDADPLSDTDIEKIKSWINFGANGPAENESVSPSSIATVPAIHLDVPVVSPVVSMRFSPDGKILAVGGYREIRLLDPLTGNALGTLSGNSDYVRSIVFSPDGTMLAAAGGAPQIAGEIEIWNLQSRQVVRTLKGHSDCIYSVAWSLDGRYIASASYDKMVKLWDASSGKEVRNLQDHIDAVFAVAFSPNGKRLASASQDRTVKIWDVETGKRLYTLSDAADGLTSIAFSPLGDRVAAVGYDKTIYVWDLAESDGHLRQSLIADEDSLLALLWSQDGKTIVTSSSDGSIRLRNSGLDLLGVIDRQPDWVEAIALSPDGKWLAAGRYNGTLSIYDMKTYQETRSVVKVFDPITLAAKEKD